MNFPEVSLLMKPRLPAARLLLTSLASGALLTACAAPVPIAAVPAAVVTADSPDDVAQVDRVSLALPLPQTVSFGDDVLPAFVIDAQEVPVVEIKGGVVLTKPWSPVMRGEGGPGFGGKMTMDPIEFTVAGYNPALTKWFMTSGKADGPVAFVYRAKGGKKGDAKGNPDVVSYSFTGTSPTKYDVRFGEDGKLTTRLSFIAATVTATVGAKPSATSQSFDFTKGKKVDVRPPETAGAKVVDTVAAPLENSLVTVDDVKIGNATVGTLFSFERGSGRAMNGAPAPGGAQTTVAAPSNFVVSGYNELLSRWMFDGNRPKSVSMWVKLPSGDKQPSGDQKDIPVLQVEYLQPVALDYRLGNRSTVAFRAARLKISETTLDKSGKPLSAQTTYEFDVEKSVFGAK